MSRKNIFILINLILIVNSLFHEIFQIKNFRKIIDNDIGKVVISNDFEVNKSKKKLNKNILERTIKDNLLVKKLIISEEWRNIFNKIKYRMFFANYFILIFIILIMILLYIWFKKLNYK